MYTTIFKRVLDIIRIKIGQMNWTLKGSKLLKGTNLVVPGQNITVAFSG